MNYYNQKLEEIYKELNSSYDGLKQEKIAGLINKYGVNEIKEAKKKSLFKRFLSQFNDMMIIILIVVAIIMGIYGYLYTHEYTDTIVIAVVVFLNAIMGFIQEQKAEVTLSSLKKYATSSVKVKRNGTIKVVDSKELVPGDIILLEAGDIVPADARIIEQTSLSVSEAALTGESVPVKKIVGTLKGKKSIQDQTNMLFSGTSITNGKCIAIVLKTGMLTELGLIAVSLNTPYEVETPLQIKIKDISKKITFIIFIILIVIFIFGVINHYELLEMIMLCVSLAVAAIPEGLPAVITITLSGGAGSLARKKAIVRQINAVETLGSTNIICSDKTGTITQNKMTVSKTIILDDKWFKLIACLDNETIIDGSTLVGDPTETCLFDYLKSNSFDIKKTINEYPRIGEIPFDSERKLSSTINTINKKDYILVKGSLENLLNNSSYYLKNGKKTKLTKKDITELRSIEKDLASAALRVIGFAYKEVSSKNYSKEENKLIYVGMVGIIDPPRKNVEAAVKKCLTAGIKPIMITGDSIETASAIAKSVGILKNSDEAVMGSILDNYTDEELIDVVSKYSVYARVSPDHKRRIVTALQATGNVVAMTGDGVNDAPAIKDAHVGVGMGITGSEVTKNVADIILLDDSFTTIVDAVNEGRRIFTNIRNNVVYSLSSNFAEIFTILIGMITGNTILLPIHLLFIDLVTDSIPSICLSFEKAEKGIMKQEPRDINKTIFTPFVNSTIAFSAIIETMFVVLTFFLGKTYFDTETAMTLALLSLVMQEILFGFSCRNLKEFTHRQGLFSNKAMNIGIIFLLFIEAAVFFTPIGSVLNIKPLSLNIVLMVMCFNIVGFFIYELIKPYLKAHFKD